MTIAAQAKETLRELKSVRELIFDFEFEVLQYENHIENCKLEGTEPPANIFSNLKESKHLLNVSIDRWNELTNTKLTKVTE